MSLREDPSGTEVQVRCQPQPAPEMRPQERDPSHQPRFLTHRNEEILNVCYSNINVFVMNTFVMAICYEVDN